MIKLGFVGTSDITKWVLSAIKDYHDIQLEYICSRSEEKGQQFIQDYNFKYHVTTIDELCQSDVDAVYIASPNHLHYAQAKQLLTHHKHILLEKPFTTNSKQMEELFILAKKNNLILMEALFTVTLPNFKNLQNLLPKSEKIQKVQISYAKVTSKLESFLQGNTISSLSANSAGGSLMDLGVYALWFAVSLWGAPKNIIVHSTVKLPTNIDGKGQLELIYNNFNVDIVYSKISNDGLDAHIVTENQHIIINNFSQLNRIMILDKDTIKDHTMIQNNDPYFYEIEEFVKCIHSKTQSSYNSWECTRIVMNILDEARKQMNIRFADDN